VTPLDRRPAVRAAFFALLHAWGAADSAEADTANRATSLWLEHLLAGQNADPAAALGRGAPATVKTPVHIDGLGFHMVCPHHLTVASGTATVAYAPMGRLVGFGHLAALVHACTARLVLQEEATEQIGHTLRTGVNAKAVAVRLQAHHPCHSVLYPRSHGATATTWALVGDPKTALALQQAMPPATGTAPGH
jgi:GTP cyclohydrolase I